MSSIKLELLGRVIVRKTPLQAAEAAYYYTSSLNASACLPLLAVRDAERNISLSLGGRSGTILVQPPVSNDYRIIKMGAT